MTQTRFDFAAETPPAAALGATHFIAIGGAGMSAVARLMLAAGVPVSGSDAKDSAALRAIERDGATVRVGHSADSVAEADTVVVSSAIREDNVELVAARTAGLRVLHRSQGLASLGAGRRVIAVAGANGKSTTTSMIVVALTEAGRDPAFASGAEIPQLGTNAALGGGADFVVEADESDGSFVVYHPAIALVTNVQPDHLDYYGDFDGVRDAYTLFVDSMRDAGTGEGTLLVACADDPGARDLALAARQRGHTVFTYGEDDSADVRITDIQPTEDGASARLSMSGAGEAESHQLRLAVPGRHNVENATGAFIVLTRGCGLSAAEAVAGLGAFTGAARRFESHGEHGGVRVIDDYAHNAPKVAAAVRTGAELARRRGGRLVAVFQPHLYSRTRDFAQGFAEGLAVADEVVLLDIYGAREDPIDGVTTALIADPLRQRDGAPRVVCVTDFAEAVDLVQRTAASGDVVMTIGAGDVTTLAPAISAALDATSTSSEADRS